MVKKLLVALFVLQGMALQSQEVLLPLQTGPRSVSPHKGSSLPLTLPFFDDFSSVTGTPSQDRWMTEGGASVATGAGLLPPTVGVATLDAIGADGRLYVDASVGRFAGDTLCSRSIDLSGLTEADSVVLSFYYLPGGGKGDLWCRTGDAPEMWDSLMLDFYRSSDSTWLTMWAHRGVDVDSLIAETGREWQYVSLTLKGTDFFNANFAFRFRNYASLTSTTKPGLAGNCDYWHLDYIFLDRNRTASSIPEFRDVAFVNPAPSMLTIYQAMPARQYRQSDMVDNLSMVITNLYSSELATQYKYAILDDNGDTLYQYDGGYENAPPYLPDGSYQESPAHASPAVAYVFPEGELEGVYTVVHTVREGVGGDDYTNNDTVRFRQVFGNYYAYDDGTAENGYGLTSTASHVYLAYRFDLNTEDTLTALDIYFNRTYEGENEAVPFNITVWSNDDGQPGQVIYRDHTSRRPAFAGLDTYCRFQLEEPVLVNGSVFVGFDQGNNNFINIGFDRNNNVSDRIYYMTSTSWQQSILCGALMMRPCFGIAATVGIEGRIVDGGEWMIYPNPADERIWVRGMDEEGTVTLYDMMGRRVASGKGDQLSVKMLPNGVYMVRCADSQGTVIIKKIIIKH